MNGEWLVDIAFKSTLVLAAGAAIVSATPRRSAAWRHWVWTLTFAVLLVLPVLKTAAPTWGLAVLPPETAVTPPALAWNNAAAAPEGRTSRAQKVVPAAAATPPPLLWFWAAGAAVGLALLLRDRLEVARLARAGFRPPGSLRREARRLIARFCPGRRVRIRLSAGTTVPLTWGWRGPVILLPATAAVWGRARLRIVLMHELGHVQRHDYLATLLVQSVRALYWWHPGVWWAAGRSLAECESACDDVVLARGIAAADYAGELVDITRSVVSPRLQTASAIGFGRLRRRLEAVLDLERQRRPVGRRVAVASLMAALLAAAPFAALRPTARTADDQHRPVPAAVSMSVQRALDAIGSGDPTVRLAGAWALGERESRAGTRPLMELLADSGPEVRAMAAWALGEIKDPTALPLLLERLDDPDPLARESIVRAVGEFESRLARDALSESLSDPVASVRQAAVWSLGEIRPRVALESLGSALDDPDPAVREMAVQVLSIRHDGWGLLARSLAGDPAPRVRRAAADGLGLARFRAGVGALVEALGDSDASVRVAAARALGRLGDSRAVSGLISSLRDPAPEVRWMATWALDEISQ